MPVKVPWMKGVFPALVTPFDKKENVDEETFRNLIRQEQKRLVEIAVEEAGGKPVIAGAGAPSTRQAIELARDAKEAGATACLIVTPYFLHPSDKGVYQHFSEIAQAVDIPIILYNIPQVMDAYLPRRVVEDLADIPNIVGLKDSSGKGGVERFVRRGQRYDPGQRPGLPGGVAAGLRRSAGW